MTRAGDDVNRGEGGERVANSVLREAVRALAGAFAIALFN